MRIEMRSQQSGRRFLPLDPAYRVGRRLTFEPCTGAATAGESLGLCQKTDSDEGAGGRSNPACQTYSFLPRTRKKLMRYSFSRKHTLHIVYRAMTIRVRP